MLLEVPETQGKLNKTLELMLGVDNELLAKEVLERGLGIEIVENKYCLGSIHGGFSEMTYLKV